MGNEGYYELNWPQEHLSMEIFAHEILNYRYHWHLDEMEMDILLNGSEDVSCGAQNFCLKENDVMLLNPLLGHATFARQKNTRALVLRFSTDVFRPYVKKGYRLAFPDFHSDEGNRNSDLCRRLRFLAAQILEAAYEGGPYSDLAEKGGLELLIATLCQAFSPETVPAHQDADLQRQMTVKALIDFMEQHYAEKITLEDAASQVQYNRTYTSTLFKNMVGINFYEYLMRLRLRKACMELVGTGKNLTEIAIDNGFSDLKSFNSRFRETFGTAPAEYRSEVALREITPRMDDRAYCGPEDAQVRGKLKEYLCLG